MRKVFKYIHLWLSIPAGIIIISMCLTGAIMVFQEEILRICHPERYVVRDDAGERLSLDEIVERTNLALEDDSVSAVQIYGSSHRTYVATLASGQRSHAYIDPYTGEIQGYYNYRAGFFHQVMRLHRWLTFKNTATGRIITGISTLCFVVILITGIVRWWPGKNKFKKTFFKVKWKAESVRRTFDLHRILGLYACMALLVLSLTGLMWSFGWYRNSVATLFNIEKVTETHGSQRGGDRAMPAIHWQQILDDAKNQLEDFEYVRIAGNGTVTALRANAPHPRATDVYRYTVGENKLETVSIYGEDRNQSYMMTWAYALHVGSWGGIFSKILTFLAAIIGASLPVTGYMLWFKKKIRSSYNPQLNNL